MPINPLPPTPAPVNIQAPAGTFGSQYGFLPLAGEGITEAVEGYFKGKEQEQKTEFDQTQAQQKAAREQAAEQSLEQYRSQELDLRKADSAATADWKAQDLALRKSEQDRLAKEATDKAFNEHLQLIMKFNPGFIGTPEGRDWLQQHGIDVPPMAMPRQLSLGNLFPSWDIPADMKNMTLADLEAQGVKPSEIINAYKPAKMGPIDQAIADYVAGSPQTARAAALAQGRIAQLTRPIGTGASGQNHVWAAQMKYMELYTKAQAADAMVESLKRQIAGLPQQGAGILGWHPGGDPNAKSRQQLTDALTTAQAQAAQAHAEVTAWEKQMGFLGITAPGTAPGTPGTPGTTGPKAPDFSSKGAPSDKVWKQPDGSLWRPDGKGGWTPVQ